MPTCTVYRLFPRRIKHLGAGEDQTLCRGLKHEDRHKGNPSPEFDRMVMTYCRFPPQTIQIMLHWREVHRVNSNLPSLARFNAGRSCFFPEISPPVSDRRHLERIAGRGMKYACNPNEAAAEPLAVQQHDVGLRPDRNPVKPTSWPDGFQHCGAQGHGGRSICPADLRNRVLAMVRSLPRSSFRLAAWHDMADYERTKQASRPTE